MNQRISTLTILTISLLASLFTRAQEVDSTTTKPEFKISINYHSNLNYYGRVDSLKSSGVFPMAELWFTPKVYVNAAPIFVNNALQSMDYAGTVATLGYQHVTDKWITSFSLLKPFYTEEARLVQSALKAQTNASFTRLNNVLNITVGGDIKFSDKMDFGATAGLDHIFRIQNRDNSMLIIDPGFYAYAGTQQFSRTYTRKKGGNILIPPTQERVTETGTDFNILAYEVSVPVIFVKGRFQVLATPAYIMPKNLQTVSGRPDLSEQGENTFYTTLGVKYTF